MFLNYHLNCLSYMFPVSTPVFNVRHCPLLCPVHNAQRGSHGQSKSTYTIRLELLAGISHGQSKSTIIHHQARTSCWCQSWTVQKYIQHQARTSCWCQSWTVQKYIHHQARTSCQSRQSRSTYNIRLELLAGVSLVSPEVHTTSG